MFLAKIVENGWPIRQRRGSKTRAVHQCVKCGACFRHTRKLVEHLKNLHNIERAFSCDECDQTFRSPMNIARHKLIHTGLKVFVCELCDYSTNQKSNLECHRRRHAQDYSFKCETCERSFYHRTEYLEHRNAHTRKNLYRCEHCHKSYLYKKNLSVHLVTQHAAANRSTGPKSNARARHACKLCPERFVYKRLLRQHMKSQHGLSSPPTKHLCDLCGAELSSRRRLTVHKRAHTGEKVFECDTCDKKFASKENLMRQKLHAEDVVGVAPALPLGREAVSVPRMRFESIAKTCEMCQEKFYFVSRLVAHLRTAHGIDRPFSCAICGKSYPQQFMLNAHVKKSHTPKTVPCGECSFMGVSAIDVERHLKRAHRALKFTCEICSENFDDKDALVAHTTMHNFTQYQRCSACDSVFDDVCRLKEHNRLHHYDPATAGDKTKRGSAGKNATELKCDACGEVFKYKSMLKQHQAKAHGDPLRSERRSNCPSDPLYIPDSKNSGGSVLQVSISNGNNALVKDYPEAQDVTAGKIGRKKAKRILECPICSKRFNLKHHVKRHMSTRHRVNHCKQCDKKFRLEEDLRRHQILYHKLTEYSCNICPFVTMHKGFYTRHLRKSHKEVQMPVCKLSKYACKTQAELRAHMKTVHKEWFLLLYLFCGVCIPAESNATLAKYTHPIL
ncbi:PREDICTED: zinc finger protein draculin-like [Dinoponera quadriceps]|uniref:Zinc finger protein draculin-like n=1 Tax=Dinoponera quadriceps TaxID=609295 RepID=A0A6P3X0N7_DINQU|nr:PREDICTED: zinc finger protein draculin-like [Dinoponera quadriceps]